MGVMEAVGEEEDRESGEEAVLIANREVEEAPSEADMSLFISSLLRRDTAQNRGDDFRLFFTKLVTELIYKRFITSSCNFTSISNLRLP